MADRRGNRVRRLFAGLVAAVALVFAVAAPAAAHATLERTDPSDGSVLAVQPSVIAAQFDEAVGVSADSLRVFSPTGQRADNGNTGHGAQNDIITISLRSGLGNGTYTVAWHVISADSHPVSGAFSFSIGAPSKTTVNPTAILTKAGTFEGVAYGFARWAAYLAFALLAGAVVFLALCWPKGARAPGSFRMIVAGWVTLVVASLLQLLLQGVYASGLPPARMFDASVIQSTTATRFGVMIEVRLLILALAAPALALGVSRLADAGLAARLRAAAVALAGTAALAVTWAGTGHASTGIQVPLSVASDILHLSAMAVWLGGLAMLVFVVLRDPGKPKRAALAVSRFSSVALACVCVLICTGAYQAWRDVGSLHVLFAETYGRLILVKILGLLVLIGLGYYARRRIAFGLGPALAPRTPAAPRAAVAASASRAAGIVTESVDTREAPLSAKEPESVRKPESAKEPERVFGPVSGLTPRQAHRRMPARSGTSERIGQAAGLARRRNVFIPGRLWTFRQRGQGRRSADSPPKPDQTPSETARKSAIVSQTSAAASSMHTVERAGRQPGMNRPGRRTARVGTTPRPSEAPASESATQVTLRGLRRSVAAETAVALVVLAATAVVVASVPGRGSNGLADRPGSTDISLPFNTGTASGTVLVLVEPGKVGPNQTHLLIENGKGEPYSPVQVSIAYSLPERQLGPIDAKVIPNGPGHYIDQPVQLNVPGRWQVAITIRSDDFDETTLRVPVPVS